MVALALHKEEFDSLYEETEAINLPHGNMIYIPDLYWRKLIMKRCEYDQDMYSSRILLERTLPTIPMRRSAARAEILDSIRWYWSLSTAKRAELEARYQGIR